MRPEDTKTNSKYFLLLHVLLVTKNLHFSSQTLKAVYKNQEYNFC